MKRSLMVQKLTDSFWRHMNSLDITTDEEMYSAILQDLEDAGMAPPEIETDIWSRTDCEFYRVHEWENEEKK